MVSPSCFLHKVKGLNFGSGFGRGLIPLHKDRAKPIPLIPEPFVSNLRLWLV
jgi:hypothetical protein